MSWSGAAENDGSPWVAFRDDDDDPYFFNTETEETSWDIPAEGVKPDTSSFFDSDEEEAAAALDAEEPEAAAAPEEAAPAPAPAVLFAAVVVATAWRPGRSGDVASFS